MERRFDIETLQRELPFYKIRLEQAKKRDFGWKREWHRFDAKNIFNFDISSLSKRNLEQMRSRQEVLLDGNHAALSVLERVVDGLCGYPGGLP